MDIQFKGLENLGNALWLMLLGMVGIFVVMVIIMGAIAILNKTTATSSSDDETDDSQS